MTFKLTEEELLSFWKEKLNNVGRPYDLIGPKNKHLLDFWKESVEDKKNKPAFICLGAATSFNKLDELSDKFAIWLTDRDYLKKGDKVAIMLPNCLQFAVALIGILKAGMVAVPCNPLYTKDEIFHQIKDSDSKILIALDNILESPLKAIEDDLAEVSKFRELIITSLGDGLRFPKNHITDFVVRHIKKMVPKNIKKYIQKVKSNKNVIITKYSELIRSVNIKNDKLGKRRLKNIFESIKPKDAALIMYTGGTTGVSKGAVLSHKAVVSNILMGHTSTPIEKEKILCKDIFDKGENPYFYMPLPMYHVYSLTTAGFLSYTVYYRLTTVTLPNPRDLDAGIKILKMKNLAISSMIDTLVSAYLNHPKFNFKLHPEMIINVGGMPTNLDRLKKWKEKTSAHLSEGYGMSEASPLITWNPCDNPVYGTVGVPMPESLLKLVDDDGNDLPLGAGQDVSGEIWVKGPHIMDGYYNKPAETKNTLTEDGWLKTGDIGTIDSEGFLRIVDRKKDMILVSGFNVFPNEVEKKAVETGLVLEAAAIGTKDDKTGERIILFVVVVDKNKNKEELILNIKKELSKSLTNYKRPSEVIVIDALPKSVVGKVLKKDLKKLYNKA